MQTEETIDGSYSSVLVPEERTNGSDYQSNTIEASTEYPFDAPTVTVEIPRGKDAVLTVIFAKPELEHYLDLEKATQMVSRVVDGAMFDDTPRHDANEEFFDALVSSASARRRDQIRPFKEYSATDCKRFTFELKNDAVARLTSHSFEVIADDDLGLFDDGGPLIVRQKIGDVASPSYVIDYQMNSLTKAQRREYQDAIKVGRRVKNGNVTLETKVHIIKKALKLFSPNLIGIEGGRMEMGPFTPQLKDEFAKMIDPMFQVGVIDAVVGFYSRGRD